MCGGCSCCAQWIASSLFQWQVRWHVSWQDLSCCCRQLRCGIEMLRPHWNSLTSSCRWSSWSNVGANLNIGLTFVSSLLFFVFTSIKGRTVCMSVFCLLSTYKGRSKSFASWYVRLKNFSVSIHQYNAHFSKTHVSLKRIWRHWNLWRHKAFSFRQASTTDLSHSLFE